MSGILNMCIMPVFCVREEQKVLIVLGDEREEQANIHENIPICGIDKQIKSLISKKAKNQNP